ncbi:MAG: hypothetical protein ACE5HA_04425 [Anaerolineae bacterium]
MSGKYLIPIDDHRSAVSIWTEVIQAHSSPGDVVLVPFAEDVWVARAALDQARRAILMVRTPAQQLRLWGSLSSVSDADRQRALARLAGTTKRDTPLDLYIQDLYQTTCPACGEPTPATAFIWDRARQTPVEKELACKACGFQGRAPADDGDTACAARFERRGLSFWFILEWLVDAQDTSGREVARRRLDQYSPRNLTALADITRKIDAELSDDPAVQRILRLQLLHALDAGRLQPTPVDSDVPNPSTSSAHQTGETSLAMEPNIWHLLTQAPPENQIEIPLHLSWDLETFFGESDPRPNVAVVAGPIRQLARQLPAHRIALILGAPPALDVEKWIWEQLWSRWVFGRGGAGGLQPPIGGWTRHVRALGATLAALSPALRADGQVLFRFQDDDPTRAAATLMAMSPGASLEAFIYQPRLTEPAHLFDAAGGVYDMTFRPSTTPSLPTSLTLPDLAEAIESAAVQAAVDLLRARAEPAPFGWIFTAVVVNLAESGVLRQAMVALEAEISPLAFVQQHVRQGLRAALSEGVLTAVVGDKPTHWWLPKAPPGPPLAERVEDTLVDLLKRESPITPTDVYRYFPGWLTPEAELVAALLAAHGVETGAGIWERQIADPAERKDISDAVHHLGKRLGFSVGAGIADVVWGEGGRATHAFRIAETGRWDDLGIDVLPEAVAGYLVVPDRLVDLLRVKLGRNPLWRRELAERRWSPIKARHLQTMAGEPEVDRQEFKKIVGLEPIIEQAEAQIPLF